MDRVLATAVALLLVVAGIPLAPVAGGPDGASAPPGRVDGRTANGALPAGGSATGSGTAASPPRPVENSTARMVIAEENLQRTDVVHVGPNLAATLAIETAEMRQHHRGQTLRERFDVASHDLRVNLLDRALIELEARAMKLTRRQRAAIAAYANGSMTAKALLGRLAAIHRAAGRILDTVSRIKRLANLAGAEYLNFLASKVREKLLPLRGPVRGRIADALAANEPLPPVRVRASDSAVVLAMIDDGTYYREAYFTDNRAYRGQVEVNTVGDATSLFDQYYPWAFRPPWYGVSGFWQGKTFVTTIDHSQGTLVSFLDARTGEVFREIHRLDLSKVPTDRIRTVTKKGVRVVLNRSYPGGPVRLEIYDVQTGERVGGIVRVGNRTLGATGSDGTTWFVEPRSSYTVVVESGAVTVSLNVSAPRTTSPR